MMILIKQFYNFIKSLSIEFKQEQPHEFLRRRWILSFKSFWSYLLSVLDLNQKGF